MSRDRKGLFKYLGIIFIATLLTYKLPHDSYSISEYLIPVTEGLNVDIIFKYLLALIFYSTYLMVILNLKKVLKLIAGRDPFNSKTIVYFKRIGHYILAAGILYGVISYPGVDPNFGIFATSYGSLKPAFFIHIILGLFSFIISDVFKMAKEIKDENDLS